MESTIFLVAPGEIARYLNRTRLRRGGGQEIRVGCDVQVGSKLYKAWWA